jgi:hypothetical protein
MLILLKATSAVIIEFLKAAGHYEKKQFQAQQLSVISLLYMSTSNFENCFMTA